MINGSYLRFVAAAEGDRIIQELQTQQHLRPHQSLDEALTQTRQQTGFCPAAGQRALQALGLDPTRKVGRLKRCELIQLARTIHRLWTANAAQAV